MAGNRRFIGLILGSGLGLAYGIFSQSINRIMLPGIMLHQPPFGLAGNIILWMLVGAALGTVISWSKESLFGVVLGAVCGAAFVTMITLNSGGADTGLTTGKILSVTFLFLPIVGLFIPLTGIFRWTVNKVIEAQIDNESTWNVIRWPILLLVLVSSIGTFALMPPHARVMLVRADALLKQGLESSTQDQLPEPLQDVRVGGFLENAAGEFSLEWENTNINRFVIPRPLTDRPWEESAVIAHFDSGWRLVCLYADTDAQPACRGFTSW